MHKNYENWFRLKSKINNTSRITLFQEREIWWCSIGINIGYEIDGKNNLCERPVLAFKKYNSNQFLGLPLSSVIKTGKYYSILQNHNTKSIVLLSQSRVLDSRRLIRKLTKLTTLEFKQVKSDWLTSLA
jgi:mRNA interferase MazF